MNKTLIQIVPELPPAINGVGDYALVVARLMRRDFGIDTIFLLGSDGGQVSTSVDDFRVRRVAIRSSSSLSTALDDIERSLGSSSVLLQLSGYGYATRGCPFWLLQGLKRWRSKQPRSRLITMFHELYAFGPPWSSAFWLSPAQRAVSAGIAQLSDIAITNIELHRGRLERLDPSKQKMIATLAVPSNVGEPSKVSNLDARRKNMIVFGQPALRKKTYENHLAALQQACQQLGIAEVHDVGAEFSGIPEFVGDIQVRKHGLMGESELTSLLSDSMAGFLDYFPGYLAKSGVFAAYCAHGMIPVLPTDGQNAADGLGLGTHYYGVTGKRGTDSAGHTPQAIADAAWGWYQRHSLQCHAKAFAQALLK